MTKVPYSARPKTVADVARAANVSKATAARVLGGYGVVSDTIRASVTAAAKALDYRPNELARSMTTGRSGIIGVVVGDIENPFFSLAVRGISDAAKASSFNVILANSGEKIEAEKAAVRLLIGKRVDGLIVTPSESRDIGHLRDIHRSGRPLALLDRALPDLDVDTVTVDDREAAIRATRVLIDAGHRNIAYVTAVEANGHEYVDLGQIYTSSVRERIDGFVSACRDAGVDRPERHVRLGATGPRETRRLADELLSHPGRPTAILASDSVIALEILRAIRQRGMGIPNDISLITFHDADWTGVTTPPITVIDQPVYALGHSVAELLIRRLNGQIQPPERLVLRTAIITRGSVGPPHP
ncbi:LacI family DNA-binding transcriptional regulator [Mesorhizobium sp. M7A.F.Ca.US.008.03.1.1]|uniref:LacI family DNA-binding transcriptional regulator n=1 Tax=Mesorhizobium sp. M7A.F.Ca.US.008.03.1.1 TaxID=2496742 RepID=UPI000FCA715A|nr:LacI family DNA-binding transcriptional regulator [Mesorhizobium sp. M7A.F.Ca.US.008.03.1.1]RUW63821.1 LacI family transcriptional regulator [Mesorhizobium sp. M7A.F.Ca.US.008.03.1.1]